MIEIKVAAKETVKLSFGGQCGWPLKEFYANAEQLEAWQRSSETADRLMKKLEEAKCGPSCYSTRIRLEKELDEAKIKMQVKLVWPTAEDIAALMNEHLGRKLAHEWQPIETAPRDGRAYLVVDEIVDMGHRAQIAFWSGAWLSTDGKKRTLNPTHWMPLPEPPR